MKFLRRPPEGNVAAFIDGFNVYYSIKEAMRHKTRPRPHFCQYLWLDYRALCARLLPGNVMLGAVTYCTAYAHGNAGSQKRHRAYVAALRMSSVPAVLGRYKDRDHKCPHCKTKFKQPEEKETDVRLATSCLEGAISKNYDSALIVSADSDLAPLFETMRRCFPDIPIGVLSPFERNSDRLTRLADFTGKITEEALRLSMLAETVRLPTGRTVSRPQEWNWSAPQKPRHRKSSRRGSTRRRDK